MGFWMALALVMGSMIGSGVFLLPASLAPLGWNSVFGWLITIAGTLCMARIFATLAKIMPHAGGPYAYTRAAFGPVAGFVVAWAYWISLWIGNAAIAIAAVSYLSRLFPAIANTTGAPAGLTVAIVWMFTFINLRGAAIAGRVQLVSTIVKVLPLMVVILLAGYVVMTQGPTVIAPFHAADINLNNINAAGALALWAMLGIEAATVPADKVSDPERTIPRATMFGTAGAGLIYLFVCSAVVLMLPAAQTAQSAAPFADFVERYWGTNAALWIAAFGAISALGALNGWLMVQAELPAALARDGLFPAALGKVSARGIPKASHILSSSLLSLVVLTNYTRTMAELFQFLILLTTAITLVMYFGCALAAAKLMATRALPRTLGTSIFLVLGILYAFWTLYGAGAEADFWGAILLILGIPVYFIAKPALRNG